MIFNTATDVCFAPGFVGHVVIIALAVEFVSAALQVHVKAFAVSMRLILSYSGAIPKWQSKLYSFSQPAQALSPTPNYQS